MAFFNRKKADTTVLPEIERYYEAEKHERAGMAWLLAIVSIACVALVLIGLFFGGRWIYRKAAHTDKQTGVSTTKITGSNIAKSKDSTSKNTSDNSSTATKPTTTAPAPQAPAPTMPKTPTTQAPATTPAAPTASTPVAPTPKVLTNTGPTSTVLIFVVSVLGFTLLHNIVARRRTN